MLIKTAQRVEGLAFEKRFIAKLREGPAFSRVDDVEFRWEDATGEFRSFEAVI